MFIDSLVPPDELTDDSKLYQALAAKYGEPTDRNPPSQAKWRVGDVSLRATCVRQRNCDLVAEDNKFGDLQRKWQEEADAKERHKNAPDAPKL